MEGETSEIPVKIMCKWINPQDRWSFVRFNDGL